MATYEWANAVSVGVAPPDIPTPPTWWEVDNSAAMAIQVASPNGPGDILERVEFSAVIGYQNGPVSESPLAPGQLHFEFAGDVGAQTGPPPNALGAGVGRFALVASCDAFYAFNSPFGPSDPVYVEGVHTTRGYVTSKAIRSPAQYGSIHPWFNMGVNVINGLNLTVVGGHYTITHTFILRTLWRVA